MASITPLGRFLQSIFALVTHGMIYSRKNRCDRCRKPTHQEDSYLYLLPSFLDDEFQEDVEYYINNAVPLRDEREIPPGRRACYFNIFLCPFCGNREVTIADFLNVREQQLLKGMAVVPYAQVSHFIMESQNRLQQESGI